MSLDQLRAVRKAGKRPDSVNVIVGRADCDDNAGIVQIDCDPSALDLRPLIGLPVHVIDLQTDAGRTLAVVAALERLEVKALGVCGPTWSFGVSEDHEHAMRLYREALCRT